MRREITAQGRSRAFINGALATAGGLKDLAARLIELHGQHEHQTLLDPSTHLGVLDAFGQLEPLAAPVRATFDDDARVGGRAVPPAARDRRSRRAPGAADVSAERAGSRESEGRRGGSVAGERASEAQRARGEA